MKLFAKANEVWREIPRCDFSITREDTLKKEGRESKARENDTPATPLLTPIRVGERHLVPIWERE